VGVLEGIPQWGEDQNAESLPELPGHAAVDAKVDGVGEEDAGVDEHGHRVGQLVVYEVQVHARVDGVEGGHEHEGKLDSEEDGDDDDQHQRRVVCVSLSLVLPSSCNWLCCLVRFARHQPLASSLGFPHGGEEEEVEDDEGDAGDQLDEDHSEPEEADKVEVDEPAVNRKQPVREDRHAHFATVFSIFYLISPIQRSAEERDR